MDKDLLIVALRNHALYLEPQRPMADPIDPENPNLLSTSTIYCLEQLVLHGYTLDQKALRMLNRLDVEDQADVLQVIGEVMGDSLNWTPLVKGWNEPTYEQAADHLLTLFYNIFVNVGEITPDNSTLLPCGHYIPHGTFDLTRYNGCPFCGTPFETNGFVFKGQGSTFKVLTGWDDDDMYGHYVNLLESQVPLTKSQLESVNTLFETYELPDVEIPMRETATLIALGLIDYDEVEAAKRLLKTPADVLRMIWYNITGQIQVIEPKTLYLSAYRANRHKYRSEDDLRDILLEKRDDIKIKCTRKAARLTAQILNSMQIPTETACQIMHPKRGMWVRVIRATRLAEYARKPGYEYLRELLDKFYRRDYVVKQGLIDLAIDRNNYKYALEMLQSEPGQFARQLFSLMLNYHAPTVLNAFRKVIDKLPLRLVISLQNNAEHYFGQTGDNRSVRTITGIHRMVPVNPGLSKYTPEARAEMVRGINSLLCDALRARYAQTPMPGQKIYVAPEIRNVVLPVGDRTATIGDISSAPQGTRFDVQGDNVRIFLHWGKGMPAAPIDLDISAAISYPDHYERCNFSNLTVTGAKHSGDMRAIPDYVGTAEYIELDVKQLAEAGARYVAFVANAYTPGELRYNAMVGWMDSSLPMTIDASTGVAYDPSCVQHMVKVEDTFLNDGLVFGVLDLVMRQIIWLEMPFEGRTVDSLNIETVRGLIKKLESKVTVGQAFDAMIEAKGMTRVDDAALIDDTTLVYDFMWVCDLAAVVSVLIPKD